MEEEWRAIEGYPGYEVSNQGEVRSYWRKGRSKRLGPLAHPQVMRPGKGSGRGTVRVTLDGEKWNVSILVALAFIGPRPPGLFVCHQPWDNRLSNLYYGTPFENSRDAKKNGKTPQGQIEVECSS